MLRVTSALRRNLIAGGVAGLVGAVGFAAAHAALIVPIWTRATFGLLSGTLAGIAAGWAYTELGFDRTPVDVDRGGVWAHAGAGARFGALLWLAVVPVTLADALLPLGTELRSQLAEVAIAVLLAIGGGALLGWQRMGTRRAEIAGASATLMLTIAMGGPVPVGRSLRALAIFLAVLPVAAGGGATLSALSWALRRFVTSSAARADTITPT